MSAPSLTDTQLNVLSAAAQRDDRCAMLPANIRGGAAQKVVQKLVDLGQAQVIAMLQRCEGATIQAIMKVTGWQQHSVRGFFSAVVRRKLRLKLASDQTGSERIYRIVTSGARKAAAKRSARSSRCAAVRW